MIALAARHPEYALGFEDEVWWSRVSQPHLHSWAEKGKELHLVEKSTTKDDPDPKALACYGLLVSCPAAPDSLPEQIWLRFVEGRPVSSVTTQYLDWCCTKLAQHKKRALIMIWDNASWHLSQDVRNWIQEHNRQVRQQGEGVRIVPCFLPSKSPWLNRIEPHWVHGKRKIVEPDRLLSADEVIERSCAHYGCAREPKLSATETVA